MPGGKFKCLLKVADASNSIRMSLKYCYYGKELSYIRQVVKQRVTTHRHRICAETIGEKHGYL